jgi:hypothetical protein
MYVKRKEILRHQYLLQSVVDKYLSSHFRFTCCGVQHAGAEVTGLTKNLHGAEFLLRS